MYSLKSGNFPPIKCPILFRPGGLRDASWRIQYKGKKKKGKTKTKQKHEQKQKQKQNKKKHPQLHQNPQTRKSDRALEKHLWQDTANASMAETPKASKAKPDMLFIHQYLALFCPFALR
jgi:hypothetical protein